VKSSVKLGGVGLGLIGHAEGTIRFGLVRKPEVRAAAGLRDMALRNKQDAGAGAVMFFVLAGGPVGLPGGLGDGDRIVDEGHAGAKDFESIRGDRDDGGFEADFAGATVEEKRSFSAEGVSNVLRGGGREVREAIRAGSGDREIGGAQESKSNRMTGDAQADRGQAGGDFVGDDALLGDDEGKRAGPVFAGEAVGFRGPVGGEFAGLLDGSDVDDKRASGRALLQGIDFADGGRIKGVGTEAVDGFCGKYDESTGTKNFCCLLDFVRIRHDNLDLLSQIGAWPA